MSELVFLKLGGSLLTDKTRPMTARETVIRTCAAAIAKAWQAGTQMIIGHGSGSFGHYVAKHYGTRRGVHDTTGWFGYAEVAQTARALNELVVAALIAEKLPAVSLPPSASARARAGELRWLDTAVAQSLLQVHALPIVFGDVAIDEEWGGTIVSTEQVLSRLAIHLKPARIVLAGEVDGVYDRDPTQPGAKIIGTINKDNYHATLHCLGAARGADVTGGMADKVQRMYALIAKQPGLRVQIINGNTPGLLERALLGQAEDEGTTIY